MIRLFAIDLDGTFLDNDGLVSKVNIESIRKLERAGITPVICSGRALSSTKVISVDQIGLMTPIISFNGASIYDPITKIEIHGKPIKKNITKKVMEIAEAFGAYVQLYNGEDFFVVNEVPTTLKYGQKTGMKWHVAGSYQPLGEMSSYKILFIVPQEIEKKLYEELSTKMGKKLSLTRSERGFIEVTAEGVDKGWGVTVLANFLNINLSEIASIGDSYNDIPMNSIIPHSFCVPNAPLELKAVSKYVLSSSSNTPFFDATELILKMQGL